MSKRKQEEEDSERLSQHLYEQKSQINAARKRINDEFNALSFPKEIWIAPGCPMQPEHYEDFCHEHGILAHEYFKMEEMQKQKRENPRLWNLNARLIKKIKHL